MRDYRKLEAFQLADDLAVAIYHVTATFPKEDRSVLADQLRRAAVSIPSNIVEGCSRHTEPDFLHFMDVAYASAREAAYQLLLAERWKLIDSEDGADIQVLCSRTCKALAALTIAIRRARKQYRQTTRVIEPALRLHRPSSLWLQTPDRGRSRLDTRCLDPLNLAAGRRPQTLFRSGVRYSDHYRLQVPRFRDRRMDGMVGGLAAYFHNLGEAI